MRVIIIGLATELPLNAPEALDIADRIVRRAATIKTGSSNISTNSTPGKFGSGRTDLEQAM